MRTHFSIVPDAGGLVYLTLGQRFLQDVVFGLKFGNEIAALEILAEFLRSQSRRELSSQQLRHSILRFPSDDITGGCVHVCGPHPLACSLTLK